MGASLRLRFGDKNKFFLFHDVGAVPFDLKRVGGLHFYAQELEQASERVLLGLHLDTSLTFKTHVDNTITATKRRANMLRCLLGTRLIYNAKALLILYKGWIRSKIEYASEVYCTFAASHAKRLDTVQNMCLRTILGSSKNTPAIILENECCVPSLGSRQSTSALMTYGKILSLQLQHRLRHMLWAWFSAEYASDIQQNKPPNFFSFCYHEHWRVFGTPPPFELSAEETNPVPFAPWSSLYLCPKTLDVHKYYRRHLRQNVREIQMDRLRNTHSARWYTSVHPQERADWMDRQPAGGKYLRVISRLRSGYSNVGHDFPDRFRAESRCPNCGASDSVEHLLMNCASHYSERNQLVETVSRLTEKPISVSLLLGFANVPSKVSRAITVATAKFVISTKRKI